MDATTGATGALDTTAGGTGTSTGTTGGSGGGVACPPLESLGPFGFVEPADENDVIEVDFSDGLCPPGDFPILNATEGDGAFDVGLYRPAGAGDAWPPGQFPLLLFSHGRPLIWYGYRDTLVRWAQEGFVVVSVDGVATEEADYRAEQLACAGRWSMSSWSEMGRLDGRIVYGGHSNGGEGAIFGPAQNQDLGEFVATVALAPSDNLTGNLQDYRPLLTIQGGTDNDPTHDAIRNYDRVLPEPMMGGHGKALVWAYDLQHLEFGGSCTNFNICSATAKGIEFGSVYPIEFLRWHVYGETDRREFFATPGDQLPGNISNAEFWADFTGTPRVFGDFRVDSVTMGGSRLDIDNFQDGGSFTVEGGSGNITVGAGNELGSPHSTQLLRITWDGSDTEILQWFVGDLSPTLAADGYSHLSFRTGERVTFTVDNPPIECSISPTAPADFVVRFISADGAQVDVDVSQFAEIPVQDHRAVVKQGVNLCLAASFMRTVRIPLSEFCDAGLDIEELLAIQFRISATPGSDPTGDLLIDSMEFTASPFDDPGSCGPGPECQ